MNLNIPVHENNNVSKPSTIAVLSFNGAFPKSTGFTLGIHLKKSQLKCLCKSAFLLLFIFSCGFQEELAEVTSYYCCKLKDTDWLHEGKTSEKCFRLEFGKVNL